MVGGLRTRGIIKQSQAGFPLISVITVVFNRQKSLERAILSVLSQTYKNIEYIIIDGASNDGTLEIIKKFEDNIDYWISEPDKGMYYALNKGIDLAKGELIGLCHSDDYLFNEDVIEHVVNTHLKTDADVYHGDMIITNEVNSNIVRIVSNSDNIVQTHHSIVHPSTCIKRQVFNTLGYYNTSYRSAADYELMVRLKINNYKFHHLGIIVCGMNINDTNRVSVNCYSRLEAYHFHKILKTGNHNQYLLLYMKCLLNSLMNKLKRIF